MYFNDDITDKMGFNLVANAYDQARPHYPDVIFSTLLQAMGHHPLVDGANISRVLEIGAGSGQATSTLARMANYLDCIEPGNHFALLLREHFANDAQVNVIESTLEDYMCDQPYDLIVSACALHWVPREVAYARIHQLLQPGGWLLAIWNQPRLPAEIDVLIDSVFTAELPGFRIPRCGGDEIDLFEKGARDFSRGRSFMHCQHTIYEEPRTVDSQTLINLIWSYVSPVHLSQDLRQCLRRSLVEAVEALEQAQFQLTNYFPVVFGQYSQV